MKRRSCIHYKHQYGCSFRWSCNLPCERYELRRKRGSRLWKSRAKAKSKISQWDKAWDKAFKAYITKQGLDKF